MWHSFVNPSITCHHMTRQSSYSLCEFKKKKFLKISPLSQLLYIFFFILLLWPRKKEKEHEDKISSWRKKSNFKKHWPKTVFSFKERNELSGYCYNIKSSLRKCVQGLSSRFFFSFLSSSKHSATSLLRHRRAPITAEWLAINISIFICISE